MTISKSNILTFLVPISLQEWDSMCFGKSSHDKNRSYYLTILDEKYVVYWNIPWREWTAITLDEVLYDFRYYQFTINFSSLETDIP